MPGGEQPLYDEVTGAPLNAAASAILERSRGAASQQRPARPQVRCAAGRGARAASEAAKGAPLEVAVRQRGRGAQ